MSSSGLTLLLTISFILFTTVTAYLPYWKGGIFSFRCEPVCSENLQGETYSCFSAIGYKLPERNLIVRFLPNFEWRYYGFREMPPSKDLCRHILIADEFYSQGNKTVCSPIFPKRNYFVNIGLRSSGAKTNPDVSKMEKLIAFLGNITRLANEIQKEVMVANETNPEGGNLSSSKRTNASDERTKRVLPLLGMLAGGLAGVGSLLNPGKTSNVENVNNIVIAPPSPPVEGIEYTDTYYLRRSYREKEKDHLAVSDFYDTKSDAICYWITKDMCQKREMVICVNEICCWDTVITDPCFQVLNDNGMNIYRQSIYSIIKYLHLE